jgi:endonuclease YncB( thermonuclease family)
MAVSHFHVVFWFAALVKSQMRSITVALALIIAITLPHSAAAELADEIIRAQVVQIVDGDSLTIVIDGERVRVRLAEIDAPESKQPYTKRSKKSLSNLCFWREAELTSITKDQYGRILARVKCKGVDVNAEQVKRGMAWVYEKHAKDPELYKLQAEARAAKRGIWSTKYPVPPWQWMKENR